MLLPRLTRLVLATVLVASIVTPAGAAAPAAIRPGAGTAASERPPAWTASASVAGEKATGYVPGEVLVRFDNATAASSERKAAAHKRAGGAKARRVGRDRTLERVDLAPGTSVAQAVAAYENVPGVVSAQPNYLRTLAAVPTDPGFGEQWGMRNAGQSAGVVDADIDATDAWDKETGSDTIVVAVIDTGVDYRHPELAGNMWTNTAEQNGVPDVDDDGNGYVDDVYGIDTADNDSDPMDDHGHGTHGAGTIGAAGDNGIGVAGVNRDVRIMAVRAFSQTSGTDADAIEAIEYATAMGADVINCSWGGPYGGDGDELYAAIQASSALFSCAAGNSGYSNEGQTLAPFTPASYTLPNIVSVAASDRTDKLAFFSNYGATSVDLAAPGEEILSTDIGGSALLSASFGDLNEWQLTKTGTGSTYWALTTQAYANGPSSVAHLGYKRSEWSAIEKTVAGSPKTYDLRQASSAYAGYWIAYSFESFSDYVRLKGSRDGGVTWDTLEQFSGRSGSNPQYAEWLWVQTDLTEYGKGASQPIRLRFELSADASRDVASNEGGVVLDELTIFAVDGSPSSYESAYSVMDGTSMAAPFVSGAAALLLAHKPTLSTAQVKQTLLDTVDTKTAMSGKVLTGGRLNLNRALERLDGDAPGSVTRIAGADRFAVAEQLARATYPSWTGVEHVIVACGDNGKEADPLSAAGLAGVYDAPIVLTQTTRLPTATRRVLAEAAAACASRGTTLKVHLIGGTATLPDARWTEIATIPGVSPVKDRISGADRYAVSAAIASRMVTVAGADAIEGALIVSAENPAAFYDALAVSPISRARVMPMLAVRQASVPASVSRVLTGALAGKPRFVANSGTYVSETVKNQVSATRLATSVDRYTAAAQIARAAVARGWLSHADTAIAAKLPDALTGGAFAGARGGVMLFTDSTATLRPATDSFVTDYALGIERGWVFGGVVSVPLAAETAFRSRIH